MKLKLLEEAHIVCSTLSFSGSSIFSQMARKFDVVVIDEAAQAVEPAILVPLVQGVKQVSLDKPQQGKPPPPTPRLRPTFPHAFNPVCLNPTAVETPSMQTLCTHMHCCCSEVKQAAPAVRHRQPELTCLLSMLCSCAIRGTQTVKCNLTQSEPSAGFAIALLTATLGYSINKQMCQFLSMQQNSRLAGC